MYVCPNAYRTGKIRGWRRQLHTYDTSTANDSDAGDDTPPSARDSSEPPGGEEDSIESGTHVDLTAPPLSRDISKMLYTRMYMLARSSRRVALGFEVQERFHRIIICFVFGIVRLVRYILFSCLWAHGVVV